MEDFKDIEDYEGIYQVSTSGRVRRWRKKKKEWYYLKPLKHSGGYQRLKLRNSGNDKDVYIHRLVAEAFIIGVGNEVNHLDGDKTNNYAYNLEWCNRHENTSHASKRRITSSKYVGVDKTTWGKWRARIMVDGVRQELGFFDCETSAALAYSNAVKEYGIVNKYL